MRLKAFTSIFVAFTLSSFATEPAPPVEEAADKIDTEFRSPDGRFGLLITHDPEGKRENDKVALIELSTKRVLALLSDPEAMEDPSRARLDWSPDSKRVAAFTGGRHEGGTRIFIRDGDGFAEVKLPDLPELPDKPSAKVAKKSKGGFPTVKTNYRLAFVRWLESGVVLDLSNHYNGPSGSLSWKINITLEIDQNRRAKLKNAVKKETFESLED
jgi:hypothetical protein